MDSFATNYSGSQAALKLKLQLAVARHGGDYKAIKAEFAASGIAVKFATFGDYSVYNIKYDSLCPFTEDYMFASRGATFFVSPTGEVVQSVFAFSKFFNRHEFSRYLHFTLEEHMKSLAAQGYKFVMVNKEDGSCIRTWESPVGIFSTTLGSINPLNAMQKVGDAPTFWSKSIELLEAKYPQLLKYMKANPGVMLLSELETKWNKIVTTYFHDGDIVPFVLVDEDGTTSWGTLRELAPELFNEHGLPVRSMPVGVETLDDDIEKFYAMLTSDPKRYGVCPEGGVLYAYKDGKDGKPDKTFAIAKLKRKEYSEKHAQVSLNPGSDKDLMAMQSLFLQEKYDDVQGDVGREDRDQHITTFTAALLDMDRKLAGVWDDLVKHSKAKDRRSYAGVVNSLPNEVKWTKPYLFRLFGKIDPDQDIASFIKGTLYDPEDDVPLISALHSKGGLFWWNPSLASPSASDDDANAPSKADDDAKKDDVTLPMPSGNDDAEGKDATAKEEKVDYGAKAIAAFKGVSTQLPMPSDAEGKDAPAPSKKGGRGLLQEKQFLVLCDFDGTFATTESTDYDAFDAKDQTPIEATVGALRAYKVMDARIAMVTGRNFDLGPAIKAFVEETLGFEVEMYARPLSSSKIIHKTTTLQKLIREGDYGTVVHFEDESTILNPCADIVNSMGLRYMGHLMRDRKVFDIITSATKTVIVTLVQPPGTGKSATLGRVEEHYSKTMTVSYVSPDRITQEWRAEHPEAQDKETGKWERMPADIMYRNLMRAYSRGVDAGGLLIYDACNDKADMLKSIIAQSSGAIAATFMLTHEIRSKKGKITTETHPDYEAFAKANIAARCSGSGDANGSTLADVDLKKAEQVYNRKAPGCINQIVGRGVERLADRILSLDEMFATLCTRIDAEIAKVAKDNSHSVNAYVGIPVPVVEGDFPKPEGFWGVRYPHITTVPPTSKLDNFKDLIGQPVTFDLSVPTMLTHTVTQHAPVYDEKKEKVVKNYHVTRYVRDKHKPFECKKETDVATEKGDRALPGSYATMTGYQVFM